jgi:hypothetical protein
VVAVQALDLGRQLGVADDAGEGRAGTRRR